jgi:2'-5' RNA ligase
MRVFWALLPDEKTKGKLFPIIRNLKQHAVQGNFTAIDNLHLTIVFVGEVMNDDLHKLIDAVESISFPPFVVKTKQLGYFSNRGANDILVWHLDRSPELVSLYGHVSAVCQEKGFLIDTREYRPHFTLARKVVFSEDFKKRQESLAFPTLFMKCERLSLMESLRVNERLVYREIHGKTMIQLSEKH